MLIGIDGNEANVKNRVGSNIYAYNILWQLYRLATRLKFTVYLNKNPLVDLPKKNSWWQYKILKPAFLWTQWRLPLELYCKKGKPNVFFTPGHYAPRFCPTPSIVSIMDLAFLKYPRSFKRKDFYQLANWTSYSIKKAAHILTISQHTKKDIVNFYKVPEEKITVTYPGYNSNKFQEARIKRKDIEKIKRKYKINSDYIIYIGTLQPRKNIIRLVKAFLQLDTCNLQLIIVGKKGWLYHKIFRQMQRTDLCTKIIFTGYVSEEEKWVLLKNAKAYVLPSLYEGFGIPAVEAMACGVPVVISKVSSLPEVGGKAAIYINNPHSITSIAEALKRMLKLSPERREKLLALGLKQAQKFSWEKCGDKTIEILKKVGSQSQISKDL